MNFFAFSQTSTFAASTLAWASSFFLSSATARPAKQTTTNNVPVNPIRLLMVSSLGCSAQLIPDGRTHAPTRMLVPGLVGGEALRLALDVLADAPAPASGVRSMEAEQRSC